MVAAMLIAGSSVVAANEVILSGLGDNQGWNDGAYYTGYVTLDYNGQDYAGLCIDALHETYGNSWNAAYVPLTDTTDLSAVMQAYFGDGPSVYLPNLYADLVGFAELSDPALTESTNNDVQHSVWSQFDPGPYSDVSGLATLAQNDAPNGYGFIPNSGGGVTPIILSNFGLIVDANYAQGGPLEQVFLVEAPLDPSPNQDSFDTPEPASLALAGGALLLLASLWRRKSRAVV